jgi:hypothetical protein
MTRKSTGPISSNVRSVIAVPLLDEPHNAPHARGPHHADRVKAVIE